MNKKAIWGIIVVIIVIVLIGVSANKSKQSNTVKIGGLYLLSGPIAAVGEIENKATQIAVDTINNAGGINGKKLEVIQGDTAYDARKALSAYDNAKLSGIKLFITDGSSPAAALRKPIIDEGNFLIIPAATTPAYFDGENRTCRIALTAKSFGPGLANLLIKDQYKRASVLLPQNEYGQGLAKEFTNAYTAQGGKVVITEFYDASPGAGDYRTSISKIKATQNTSDALIFVQVANTIEPMLNQIHELGWKKPIVSDFYTIENPSLKNVSLANGIEYVTYQFSSKPQPTDSVKTAAFKAEYFKRFGMYPIYTAAATYDVISIIADAVAHVGEDPRKVGDYVSSLKNYPVTTGTLTFNSDCEVERTTAVAKIVDGQIVNE